MFASTAAHAQQRTAENTLQVVPAEVELEPQFTMAERAQILGWNRELLPNLEQGPVEVEIICSKRWSPKLNHCWVGEISNAPPLRGRALSAVLKEHLLKRQAPVLTDAMTEKMLESHISYVTFPLTITAEDLALPDGSENPRDIGDAYWKWDLGNRPARLRIEGRVKLETQCQIYEDLTAYCRAVSTDPSDRLNRMQRWLEDASMLLRVEPELSDGTPAANTIGPMKFTFR